MTRNEIIDGLKFTIEMFLLDTNTGETFIEPRNDMDKITVDACKGAIELLEQEPTADVVEVVRCKDCKYCVEHYDTYGNVLYCFCKNWYIGTDADGFCYEGERRDDGEIH